MSVNRSVMRNAWYAETDELDGDRERRHRLAILHHGHVRVVRTEAGFDIYWRGAEAELRHVSEALGVIMQVEHGWRAILNGEAVGAFQPRVVRHIGNGISEYHLFTLAPSGNCRFRRCLNGAGILEWCDEPREPRHETDVATALARTPPVKKPRRKLVEPSVKSKRTRRPLIEPKRHT